MRFRPCIDIHNGKVKQIVGGSLRDGQGAPVRENYVSEKDAAWYAAYYRERGLAGGHVILLNPAGTPAYEATAAQAKQALAAWPQGLQAGGGINPENAEAFLDAGASHVIVTSYVFREGRIDRGRLAEMVSAVGKDRLVLDLSCRKRPEEAAAAGGEADGRETYYIVTDRWQVFTEEALTPELLGELQDSCDEFLVHAADVEGKTAGIEEAVVRILAAGACIPVTYAGGVHSLEDIRRIGRLGNGRVDYTIGSALDLFGGCLKLEDALRATAGAEDRSVRTVCAETGAEEGRRAWENRMKE